ncbi:hypothetical protein WN48_03451 [Eufriesea mexicana]|nr:hypothetical protein WN48_03451 [Eufriesea mexicana]
MFKQYEVIVHKNEEEIFVGHMCHNGLYTSREEQEAGREAQKIWESMYREHERAVQERIGNEINEKSFKDRNWRMQDIFVKQGNRRFHLERQEQG